MRALLDVNVLIALLDADHSLHSRATEWFADNFEDGWASCPLTQNGCVRIMAHPAYPNAFPVKAVVQRLRESTEDALHEFWPDDVSILNGRSVDPSRIHGPRQITDVYLLALAVEHRARFVTFDNSVSVGAVPGAEKRNLVKL